MVWINIGGVIQVQRLILLVKGADRPGLGEFEVERNILIRTDFCAGQVSIWQWMALKNRKNAG